VQKVFAYCAQSFERSTGRAAGVKSVTCPPASSDMFNLLWLTGRQLLYFDLHGSPGAGFWHGDDGIIALTAEQVRSVDLGGAVVFATTCYLADQDSPMLDALLDAGASYVIGGDGQNWAGVSRRLYGASLLGFWFRRLFMMGVPPLKALAVAKRAIRWQLRLGRHLEAAARGMGTKARIEAAKDTLNFRAYYKEKTHV